MGAIEIKELSDKKIKEFHVEWDFVLALSEENKLYSWGYNNRGQLGRNIDIESDFIPTEIMYFNNSNSKIKRICTYDRTVMVLLENGKVIVWGDNEFEKISGIKKFDENLTGSSDFSYIKNPIELSSLNEIEFIYMNGSSYFAISKNSVFSWGNNEYVQLGHEKSVFIFLPKVCEILSKLKIILITSYRDVTYFLSSDGKLYICGRNYENNEDVMSSLDLIQIESDEYFLQLETIDRIVVINDKQDVYQVNGNNLIKTEYKSIEEYSVMKCGITYKNFTARFKDSRISLTEQIGHGAFGRVYKVFYQTQYYAIKKILIKEMNKSYLFENSELNIMKKLNSDLVIKLYDFWIKNEKDFEFLYIQME